MVRTPSVALVKMAPDPLFPYKKSKHGYCSRRERFPAKGTFKKPVGYFQLVFNFYYSEALANILAKQLFL